MALEHIGHYETRSELGRGWMATVLRAYDPSLCRTVAIKLLPREYLQNPSLYAYLERRVQAVMKLAQTNIVRVYDLGEHDGRPFIVMDYMPGGTLDDRLKHGALSESSAARIIAQLAPALDVAHAQAVVHRNLRPSNILFDQAGLAHLSDFSLIPPVTRHAPDLVAAAYMSPEQVQGEVEPDGASDIYSLGIILFEMVTGRRPYRADTPLVLAMLHVLEPVPSLETHACAAVVATAMAKDRDARYPTAAAMAAAMDEAAGPPSPQEFGPAPTPPELEPSVDSAPVATPAGGRVPDTEPAPSARETEEPESEQPVVAPAPPPLADPQPSEPVSETPAERAVPDAEPAPVDRETEELESEQPAAVIDPEPEMPAGPREPEPIGPEPRIPVGAAPAPVSEPEERRPRKARPRKRAFRAAALNIALVLIALGVIGALIASSGALFVVGSLPTPRNSSPTETGAAVIVAAATATSPPPTPTPQPAATRTPPPPTSTPPPTSAPDTPTAAASEAAAAATATAMATATATATAVQTNTPTATPPRPAPKWQEQALLEGESAVWIVAWSPDGTLLAAGAANGAVQIWQVNWNSQGEIASTEPLSTLRGHPAFARSLAWSPDGSQLASGGSDGNIWVWDAASGGLVLWLPGHGSHIGSLAWSPDGNLLASAGVADTRIQVWQPVIEASQGTYRSQPWRALAVGLNVRQISWSPDSALLAFGAVDNTVALWDPAAETTTRLLETGNPDWQGVNHITWSPDGTLLAGAEGSAIWVWDTESGARLHLLEGHSAAIGSIAWLDRGAQLASVSVDGDARLWRLSAGTFEGELLHQVSGSPGQVRSIAWSPDATRLAAGGTDGAIRIWAIPLDE